MSCASINSGQVILSMSTVATTRHETYNLSILIE